MFTSIKISAKKHPVGLFVLAVVFFFTSSAVLSWIGFVPGTLISVEAEQEMRLDEPDQSEQGVMDEPYVYEYPIRIVADSIDLDHVVLNPQSRDIAVLDNALLEGVVHYPGSGDLNAESNMLLFAHSTSLQNVRNQSFTLFNGIKELQQGDVVILYGEHFKNVYRVVGVELIDADKALVRFDEGKKMLTLSTCNTFGAKQERYVATAEFIGTLPLN